MEEEPPGRRAALASRADGGEEHRAQGEIEVGVGGDEDAVVAAELEQGATESVRQDLADRLAHAHRTGRRDHRETAIGGERGADGVAVADREVPDRRRSVGGEDALRRSW